MPGFAYHNQRHGIRSALRAFPSTVGIGNASSVSAYTVDVQAEPGCTSVIDDEELYALLVGVIADVARSTAPSPETQ
jgi:hypothetical protein